MWICFFTWVCAFNPLYVWGKKKTGLRQSRHFILPRKQTRNSTQLGLSFYRSISSYDLPIFILFLLFILPLPSDVQYSMSVLSCCVFCFPTSSFPLSIPLPFRCKGQFFFSFFFSCFFILFYQRFVAFTYTLILWFVCFVFPVILFVFVFYFFLVLFYSLFSIHFSFPIFIITNLSSSLFSFYSSSSSSFLRLSSLFSSYSSSTTLLVLSLSYLFFFISFFLFTLFAASSPTFSYPLF